MADYSGAVVGGFSAQTVNRGTVQNAQTINNADPATSYDGLLVPRFTVGAGSFESVASTPLGTAVNDYAGATDPALQQFWFEHVHAFPGVLTMGNIVAISLRDMEIYNAYRDAERSLTIFANNADAGVSLVGFPLLPAAIGAGAGLLFQVRVDSNGPPSLNGTLVFTLDSGDVTVPITGVRVVMFPFAPEAPLQERLEFKTDILTTTTGGEQRISIRKHPRQLFNMVFKTEDDYERRRLDTLFGMWQFRPVGLPIWAEARTLDTAAAGATTIQVDTTYGDFRVGSLAIVWQDSATFDALEIDSLTDTSLTFSSPLLNSYDNAQVMPLRIAVTQSRVQRMKAPVNFSEMTAQFTVLDNEADLADTTPFGTHNSKVMLDDPNMMFGDRLNDHLVRQISRVDNETASLIQFSDWPDSLPLTTKGFVANTSQRVWEIRQLMHALRGSQVSFYMPTFYHDVVPNGDLTLSSFLLNIENIGYATYLQGREPNKSLWIELTDGTILTRQVVDSVEIDADTERLTVDVAWPATILASEVSRISFLRLCRIADDNVSFEHEYVGSARIGINVRGVVQ